MAVIKVRDANGVVHEIASIKGEKGEPGRDGASNAKDVSYDGAAEYVSATDVETALKATSAMLVQQSGEINGKANATHGHGAYDITYVYTAADQPINTVDEALSYLLDQVGSVSSAFDELHAYAQALVNGGDAE